MKGDGRAESEAPAGALTIVSLVLIVTRSKFTSYGVLGSLPEVPRCSP